MRTLGVGVLVAAVSWASALGQVQPFRARTDSVVVGVSVRATNRAVDGLTKQDFEIRDRGVVQEILDVSRENLPIDMTLVLDVSSSVQGTLLDRLKRAVAQVADELQPGDRCAVITFSERIKQVVGLQSISTPLKSGVPAIEASGWTSLFDALSVSMIAPPDSEHRRMVIAFTDGQDTSSFLDTKAVLDVTARSDAAVFVVAAVNRMDIRPPAHGDLFEQITEMTNGRIEVLPREGDISRSFMGAIAAFRESYVVRYTARGVVREGWHDVTVKVLRPGRYEVRARKGYEGS